MKATNIAKRKPLVRIPWLAVKEATDLEGVGGGCVELVEAEVVCVVGDDPVV